LTKPIQVGDAFCIYTRTTTQSPRDIGPFVFTNNVQVN